MEELAQLGLQLQKHHGFLSSPINHSCLWLVPIPICIQQGWPTFLSSSWENTYCSSAKEDQDKQQVLRGLGNGGLLENSVAPWFLKQGISNCPSDSRIITPLMFHSIAAVFYKAYFYNSLLKMVVMYLSLFLSEKFKSQ